MHFRAFDHAWFRRNQRWLLASLRFDAFRRTLYIDDSDDIVRVMPHAYITRRGKEYRLHAHTHWKYAKRVYTAFAPVWWAMHGWDWAVADRVAPRLSFGFSTLTVYPDTGTGSTTCDGVVARHGVDETFANIIAGAGTLAGGTGGSDFVGLIASGTTNQYAMLTQLFFSFDTASLPDNAIISAANFVAWPDSAPSTALGDCAVHILASAAAANNTLASTDYRQTGTTSFGSDSVSNFSSGAYKTTALNASGIAAISLTGVTALALRLAWDKDSSFGGTWASFGATSTRLREVDYSGTGNDPYLDVTYTVPPSSSGFFFGNNF